MHAVGGGGDAVEVAQHVRGAFGDGVSSHQADVGLDGGQRVLQVVGHRVVEARQLLVSPLELGDQLFPLRDLLGAVGEQQVLELGELSEVAIDRPLPLGDRPLAGDLAPAEDREEGHHQPQNQDEQGVIPPS